MLFTVKEDTADIKADTTVIRQDTAQIPSIKHDTSQIADLIEEIALLRSQVADLEQHDRSGGVILQRFLDESTSYAESIIDEGRDDAGVGPLLDRMQNAKTTCDELKAFYNARAALEDEYARKLLALCRKPLGSGETGTLRTSLDVLRGEVESMGKQHALTASQMKSELEEPLTALDRGMKERGKIVQTNIERLLETKQAQTAHVNKLRDKYEQDCLRIKGYLAQRHMVMGQEERKNNAELEKAQSNMASSSNEYEAAIKVLEETTGRWNEEWKAACDVSPPSGTMISATNNVNRNSEVSKKNA